MSWWLGVTINQRPVTKFSTPIRSKEKLRELQFEIAQANGVALVVEADITDAAAVQNLLDTTLKAFPKGVDVLVNNAAYVAPIHRYKWPKVAQNSGLPS